MFSRRVRAEARTHMNSSILIPKKRTANGLFVDSGQAGLKTPEEINVQSGYLELSNASAVKEMIQMIDIQRSFELYQKAIQTVSDQDRLAVSRVGRLA